MILGVGVGIGGVGRCECEGVGWRRYPHTLTHPHTLTPTPFKHFEWVSMVGKPDIKNYDDYIKEPIIVGILAHK